MAVFTASETVGEGGLLNVPQNCGTSPSAQKLDADELHSAARKELRAGHPKNMFTEAILELAVWAQAL